MSSNSNSSSSSLPPGTIWVPTDGPNAYFAPPCVEEDTQTERFMTEDGVEFVRTPDQAFDNLPGYEWPANYVTVDGMRMHYLDDGPEDAKEIILMLHGQPTWSYLYRKMIPVLVERGFRVICPDWLGMGKSDKPTSLDEHTYAKQVQRIKDFVPQVVPSISSGGQPQITLFIQDWGSLIGYRLAGDKSDWFKRIVSANAAFPVFPPGVNIFSPVTPVNLACNVTMSFVEIAMNRVASAPCGFDESCFGIWIDYALTSPALSATEVVQFASVVDLTDAEAAAYNAPFPLGVHKAAIRAFPSMLAGIVEPEFGNTAAWASLGEFPRPTLVMAGVLDTQLGSVEAQQQLIAHIPGATIHDFEHRRWENASHFIQEDVGAELAAYVADFIDGTGDMDMLMPTLAPAVIETMDPTSSSVTTTMPTPSSASVASFNVGTPAVLLSIGLMTFFLRHVFRSHKY